jgi:hypothetical protein
MRKTTQKAIETVRADRFDHRHGIIVTELRPGDKILAYVVDMFPRKQTEPTDG